MMRPIRHFSDFASTVTTFARAMLRSSRGPSICSVTLLVLAANLDALALLAILLPLRSFGEGGMLADAMGAQTIGRGEVLMGFLAAIVLFSAGAGSLVAAMKLSVGAGRKLALDVGRTLSSAVSHGSMCELVVMEQNSAAFGGVCRATRRGLRTMVRWSALVPRLIGGGLSAMLGFALLTWVDWLFALISLPVLLLAVIPLYRLNAQVVGDAKKQDSLIRRSSAMLTAVLGGGESRRGFREGGELDRSLALQGSLLTARYKAAAVRSVFMSGCLVVAGAWIFLSESADLREFIPLLIALKVFAGGLQIVFRLTIGLVRMLPDVQSVLRCIAMPMPSDTTTPAWPLTIGTGQPSVESGDHVGIWPRGPAPRLAVAMATARLIDADGRPISGGAISEGSDGAIRVGNETQWAVIHPVDPPRDDAILVDWTGPVAREAAGKLETGDVESEREVDLEEESL